MQDSSKILSGNANSKKFLLSYILIVLLTIVVVVLHFQTAKIQNSDSVRINLAGRQRMLIQKLSKEILQYSKSITQKSDLKKTIKIFNNSLNALLNGGDAALDLNMNKSVYLPKMSNLSTRKQLIKVIDLWQTFKINVDIFIKTKNSQSLNYIIQNNTKILDEMDKAVFMMQNTAEKNNLTINIILYIIYFFVLLMLTVLLLTKLYQLKHASLYIDHLEKFLPICAQCKKVREPDAEPEKQESWTAIESYIGKRLATKFSHGLCPGCEEELYGGQEWFIKLQKKRAGKQK